MDNGNNQRGPGRPARQKVRVHRSNVDPDNKNLPISVCANKPSERIRFRPGEAVLLTEAQVNILRDSVDETMFDLPTQSGIYEARDPLTAARNSYPNMIPTLNRQTGVITMRQTSPNYIIEQVT